MKKFGTRLISAVLAGCMMASVLPASAFAAGRTGSETGVSAQASENQGRILEDGEEITESGTYSMSGPYTETVTINVPDGNVVINITGPVVNSNLGRTDNALLIRNGTVTINNLQNNEFSVTSGRCIRVDVSTGAKATVTMNGGIYKSSGIETLFNFYGTVYLHDVTSFSEYDNALNNWGTAYVYGGKYESKSSAPAVYNRTGTSRIELNDDVEVSNESGCPVTNIGTADINGGRYTSQSTSLCINTTANSTTNIHGGTFEGKGTVICNRGKMTIDETKGKTEIRVAGNQTDLPRSGVRTEANAITDIASATIENAQYGIWNKENASSVTLKDAAFKDNENDVYLEAGQYITIEDTFTDTATVKVADSPIATPRQITTADATGQEKLNLVSNDKDAEGKTYFVAYDAVNNYRYLTPRTGYTVDAENAKATVDGTTVLDKVTQVPVGTPVTLTADKAPDGQKFAVWFVKVNGVVQNDLRDLLTFPNEEDQTKAILKMPEGDVTVKAMYEAVDPVEPVDPVDPVDPVAPVDPVLPGVIIGGAVILGAYETGTGIYRLMNMQGLPLPSNRIELAELVWERAGKPEPQNMTDENLYADIDADDTDAQKAAHWMVEQELMKFDEDNNKFHPCFPVSKLRVCLTWQNAKDKGLID